MKKFIKVLINLLGLMLELAVEKLNLVKYAGTENFMLFGCRGRINNYIVYQRYGVQIIRRRPANFKIKDPSYWEGRTNRFRACVNLSKTLNVGLKTLYQDKPQKMSYYNLLISQLMKFWTGGPAPAPYIFIPGATEVKIGNGKMPDARKVVFTPQSGVKLQISWDTECIFQFERPDDALQIMVIIKDGANGVWFPLIRKEQEKYIERSDGTYVLSVGELFYNIDANMEVYCAIKFNTEAKTTGKVKGIFKFPVGITPIKLIH